MSTNKNILKGVALLGYILVISTVIYGIAAVYTYLNTGADRSSILHSSMEQKRQYVPTSNWAPLTNEGRLMDDENLKSIEQNYLDAWYIKQLSLATNSIKGIDDFYTENARNNIYDIINLNSIQNVRIESTSLKHHPTLEFFSEDGQLAVITDTNVIEYKRIFKAENLISAVKEKSTYKVILLLEDGFWRIRHITRTESKIINDTVSIDPIKINATKGINYYPKDSPWDMYGENFDINTIKKDLGIISSTGLNSIRIFVPYEDFGAENIDTDRLNKLKQLLDAAQSTNLKVLVTLFDLYGDYSVLDWTLTQAHASTIVDAIKTHPALLGWDIKNEPNLDFENRGKELVVAWLDHMIEHVRSKDSLHPITIGWSNAESAIILQDKLDVLSYHFYENPSDFSSQYEQLKSKVTDKPIMVTEFGMSSNRSLWNPFGNSEDNQSEYHKTMKTEFSKQNIQHMSWTLYDFDKIPKEVVGRLPWRKNSQKYYGFIDMNGNKKPAFPYISSK